jgi:hypothetical protein
MLTQSCKDGDRLHFWASLAKPDDDECDIVVSSNSLASGKLRTDETWNWLRTIPLDVMLIHQAEPAEGQTLLAFSENQSTAIASEGTIPEGESLRDSLKAQSDTEVLLKIVEGGLTYDNHFLRKQLGENKNDQGKLIAECEDHEIPASAHTLLGLVDVMARINYGEFSLVMSQHWSDRTKALWLLRDGGEPLIVVDAREQLGQLFIVPSMLIWRAAAGVVLADKHIPNFGKIDLIQYPDRYVWLLTYAGGKFGVRKFGINRQRRYDTTFEEQRPKDRLPSPEPFPIVAKAV